MLKRPNRGLAACVACPLIFAGVIGLAVACPPVEAHTVEVRGIQQAGERRARLVRTFDRNGTRQPAEATSQARSASTSADRFAPLWPILLALGLAAAAVTGQARLRSWIGIRAG